MSGPGPALDDAGAGAAAQRLGDGDGGGADVIPDTRKLHARLTETCPELLLFRLHHPLQAAGNPAR